MLNWLFFRALYNGIVPGLQRQMAFSAIRLGMYERVKELYRQQTGGANFKNMWTR